VRRAQAAAYVVCSAIAAVAGLVVAAQVGIGDATVGSTYTLLAITAPVLGGALLTGGRGTFSGSALGALVLAITLSVVVFIGLATGLAFVLIGALTLAALVATPETLARIRLSGGSRAART
jgi:ribose transport system ATP-binding protein